MLERALRLLETALQGATTRRFQAKSSSGGGKVYELVFNGTDGTCSCPGFTYRGRCRHLQELLRALDRTNNAPEGIRELRDES
jgi:hypothetical protein